MLQNMSIIELILGIALIVLAVIIVCVTITQTKKQEGMTSAIGGTNNDSFYGKNAQNTKERALERLTKILAFIFFAIVIVVNIIE